MRVSAGLDRRVPLGPRQVAGIVWEGAVETLDAEEAEADRTVFDCPPLGRDAPFVDWVAAYTLSPPGMVVRMVLRAPERLEPEPWSGLQRHGHGPERMTRRARACLRPAEGGPLDAAGLAHAAGVRRRSSTG